MVGSEAVSDNVEGTRSQVFTPTQLSGFMASKLNFDERRVPTVLDAGAGAGALAESVLASTQQLLQLTLIEQDRVFESHLRELLDDHRHQVLSGSDVVIDSFLRLAPEWLADGKTFSHIIMNPPYARVRRGTEARRLLDAAGVRTSNMYSAFLWLAFDLLEEAGQLVAVVPRTVLSGALFTDVRKHLELPNSLVGLHHFTSRRGVFQRDSVLQEVVVIVLLKRGTKGLVSFSRSVDLSDLDANPISLPLTRFHAGSSDSAILVPVGDLKDEQEFTGPLLPPEVRVSVGSVVDFRFAGDVFEGSQDGVALIGSEIFATVPRASRRLRVNARTSKYVMPAGKYLLLKRISPPETVPRLQARILDASGEEFCDGVAFENHVLVVHSGGAGLSDAACQSLFQLFSSESVQRQIAERTGSTQINVADVMALRMTKPGP